MSTDITAIVAVFDALDATLVGLKKAKADGFPWTDAILLANLWTPYKDAVSRAKDVVAETKTLDNDDMAAIITRLIAVGEEVASIFAA